MGAGHHSNWGVRRQTWFETRRRISVEMRTLFRDKGNFVGTATRHVFRGGRGIHIRYWRKSTNLTTYKSMKKKFRNVKSKIFLKYQGKVKFVNASFVFSIFCFIFNHTFAFVVLSQILI